MQILVSIEPLEDSGFVARSPMVPNLIAQAPTVDLAVSRLYEQIAVLVARGHLVEIEVSLPTRETTSESKPWMAAAGVFENDSEFEEVIEEMKAYRKQRDAEADEVFD